MEKTSRRRKIVTIIIILNIVFAIGLVAAYFYSREEISDSEASPNEQVKQGFPGFQPKNLLKEEPRDEDSFFRSLRQSVDIGIEDEKVSQYIPGDIIVVFKDAESTIRVSSERSSSINLDADILPFEYLDKQTLPKELKDIDSKYTVKTIEKVFKGKGSPENELRNLQDRFREEIAQGEKMIDETGILSQNLSNHYMIKISDTDSTIEARSELEKSPEVLSADLNYIHSVNYTPNDPLYPLQWAHQNSKASQAWDTTLGSSNVKIAIIDTGVDYDHEDLEGSMITDCTNGCPTGTGYDFVNIDIALWQSWGYSLISGEDYTTQDNKPTDFFGHGTHCAGIAAAKGNNSKGVSGLCPNCKIMPVRVGFSINLGTNTFGVMDTLSIIEGITYAADQGADIISMSFGGSPKTTADQVAIQYAKNLGVVLIGAAGNSGQENPIASYPGAYEEVLAVSSTNNLNKMSYFSNYGYWVEVGAPGENILSTVPKTGTLSDPSGYMSLSGTSMAAPYVAGLAGLVLSQNPSWEPAKVEEALTTGVFNPITLTTYFGSGIVDSPLTLSINSFVSSPVVITSPENDNIVDGNINIVGTAQGTSYTVSVGTGLYPTSWTNIGLGTSVSNNTLATWDTSQVPSNLYTIKLTVTQNTKVKSTFKRINLSKGIRTNWPISFYDYTPFNPTTFSHAVVDLNNDQIKEIILGSVNEKKVFDLNGNKIDGWPVVDYTTGSLGFMQLLLLTIGKTDGSSYEILFPRHDMILDPYNPEDISYCFNNHYFNGSKKPGWPVRCDKTIDESQLVRDFSWLDLTGISLHDINNDGKNEVIGVSVDDPPSLTESNNDIFVLNGDGTNFPGWPVQLPIGYLKVFYGPIAVANVDNDSGKELVLWAINPNNQTFLFIFETNGTLKSGYPKTLFNSLTIGGPILVDIDNDGALEFPVFSDRGKCDTNGGQIRYMNLDGTTVPGWPKNFEQEAFLFAPTIGDIDRDGSVETIFGTSGINGTNGLCLTDNYKVYAFKSNGTLMPGWPVTVKGQILSQATIGDVNGDFSPDVLVSTLEGFVYAIDKSGQILNGFPRIMDDPSDSGIEIGDFDNDQKVEILGSTSYTKAFLWDLNVPYNPQTMLWPVFMKDSARTGVYLGTPTPQPTNTMTPTPSRTPTPQLTNSVTPTPSRTPTPQLTNSVTPTPSRTPTPQLTNSVTPTPSRTPTPIPSWTPNPSISVTPTKTPVPVTITPTTSTSTGAILCGRADIDSDNKFNILDFSDFAIKYNKSCNDSPAQYTSYEPCKGKDYDRNSRIDILDFASFASRYMKASCAIN